MDWETGLVTISIIGIILTVVWIELKCSNLCSNKVDIGPAVMWFKMFAIITWITFFSLLTLHCFIGK